MLRTRFKRERRGLCAKRERPIQKRKKGIMEKQYNPNEPGKPTPPGQQPGQQGGQQGDREKEKRDREKQGTGVHQGGGGQQGGGQQTGGQ